MIVRLKIQRMKLLKNSGIGELIMVLEVVHRNAFVNSCPEGFKGSIYFSL